MDVYIARAQEIAKTQQQFFIDTEREQRQTNRRKSREKKTPLEELNDSHV